MSETRKLAAIVVADVVGYSRVGPDGAAKRRMRDALEVGSRRPRR